VIQGVLFRVSFWFRPAFEDGEEENTLSKMGQGHLMIFSELIVKLGLPDLGCM